MKLKRYFAAGATALVLNTTALFAGDIMVMDPYARSSTPTSVTGAAFLTLMNHSNTDDRLISVRSDAAKRVELHTHEEDSNGVMKMIHVETGFAIPAGGMHALKRGGDHIMFMGLTQPLVQGAEIAVTLTFEQAGEVEVMIPVDLERKPDHSAMDHNNDS